MDDGRATVTIADWARKVRGDQFFDFTAQVIDVQRNLIKQFITTSAGMAEEVTENISEHTFA